MRILITGGAGFIGSNLALAIQETYPSWEIAILDDLSSGSTENLNGFRGETIKGKVEDGDFINGLSGKRFDLICHEAALTDTTMDDSERMMGVNVDGFRNILNLARKGKSQVIYASSAGVYGNGPSPMKESQKLDPQNAYALSKVKADELALDFIRDMRLVGLRYFNVYGRGEKHKGKAASMIWQLANQMKKGMNPRIFKYGEQGRDFVYIKDVVEANIKAMEARENGIVNIGTGVAASFNQVIEILNHVLGTHLEPEYFDNLYSFYQNHTQADTSMAEKLLGFKARFSLEAGIRDYLGEE